MIFFFRILFEFLFKLAPVFGHDDANMNPLDTSRILNSWKLELFAYFDCIERYLQRPTIFSQAHTMGGEGLFSCLTPLQVAAVFNFKEPLIARCIAEILISKKFDPNQVSSAIFNFFYCLDYRYKHNNVRLCFYFFN